MGVDIRAYIEIKFRGPDYDCVAEVFLARDYDLFRRIGWQNNPDLAIFRPRGFPDGASFYVDGQYHGLGVAREERPAHWMFPSWLNSAEFATAVERAEQGGKEVPASYYAIHTMMRDLPDCRLVFWWEDF